jgi:hypothetical protein
MGTRSRRFSTDIQNVGSLADQALPLFNGCCNITVQAVTGKRIVGEIDDAHDQGAFGIQDETAAMEVLVHEKNRPPNSCCIGGL